MPLRKTPRQEESLTNPSAAQTRTAYVAPTKQIQDQEEDMYKQMQQLDETASKQ